MQTLLMALMVILSIVLHHYWPQPPHHQGLLLWLHSKLKEVKMDELMIMRKNSINPWFFQEFGSQGTQPRVVRFHQRWTHQIHMIHSTYSLIYDHSFIQPKSTLCETYATTIIIMENTYTPQYGLHGNLIRSLSTKNIDNHPLTITIECSDILASQY